MREKIRKREGGDIYISYEEGHYLGEMRHGLYDGYGELKFESGEYKG